MRFLCLALAILATPASAQLSGTYTVGGTSPDFATPQDAADALVAQGVSGNAVFQIRPGTYDGGLDLGEISGVSETARVRFEAEDDANPPVLRRPAATATDDFVVRLDGTDWVTFRDLRLLAVAPPPAGRLVVLLGDTDHITLRRCELVGLAETGDLIWSVGVADVNDFTLDESTLTNGERGVHITTTTEFYHNRPTLTDNVFSGQTRDGIRFFDAIDGVVNGNTITDAVPTDATYPYTAIWFSGADSVRTNVIDVRSGARGMNLSGPGPAHVVNNTVSVQSPSAEWGIRAIEAILAHNTIRMAGSAPAIDWLVISWIEMYNNILITDGAGPVLRYQNDSNGGLLLDVKGNLFYAASGPLFEWPGGVTYNTIADWQAGTGEDPLNTSVSQLVTFANTAAGDLRLSGASLDDLALIGTPLPPLFLDPFSGGSALVYHDVETGTDLDGAARDPYNPKMGAHEGTPLPPFDNADAGGFYAVAGASPDFTSPSEAFTQLAGRGMKGPVTLRIRAGTYTVRQSFLNDLRVGDAEDDPAAAPLTIRGANPASPPTLVSDATAANNWTLRFRGLDHVELADLAFDASGAGDNGRILVLKEGPDGEGTDHFTLTASSLTGATSGVDSNERALLWSDDDGHDELTISGNTFTNGWAGVHLAGSPSDDSPGATISDNTFDGQTGYGLYGSLGDVIISGNGFSSLFSSPTAIRLGATEGYRILGNQIYLPIGSAGIALVGTDADSDGTALLANNMVRAGPCIALSQGATGARIIHNSLYSRSGSPTLSVSGANSEVALLTNTILIGIGPVLSLGQSGQLLASDGNILAPNLGPALVEVGATTYADLAAWQAGSGFDANSESFTPSFVDFAGAADFHLTPISDGDLRLVGLPGTGILSDFDGEIRSVFAPYIGADEGTPFPLGLELAVSVALQGAYDDAASAMRTDLAADGHLPLAQPYADPAFDGTPLDYDGPENVASIPPSAVDWVLLELRETDSGPAVARGAFLLGADGQLRQPAGSTTLAFPTALPGSYHIVVRHRNHLSVMSTARALSGTSVTVDLRLASSLYGGAAAGVEVEPGVLALAAADGSFDGLVTAPDFNVYSSASAAGATGYRVEDYTLDGLVTAPDFNLYNANAAAGAATAVPEN